MTDRAFANPLSLAVMHCLQSHAEPLSEYQLLQLLEAQGDYFSGLSDSPQLALFQRHFIVMNALYDLQKQLLGDQLYLSISALSIHILPMQEAQGQALIEAGADERLQDYYCNWQNFESTDEQQVDDLLSSFWQRYLAEDKQVEALAQLGLEAGADWQAVRESYRRLAAKHHPDRGGEPAKFMSIREAFEVLSRSMAT